MINFIILVQVGSVIEIIKGNQLSLKEIREEI